MSVTRDTSGARRIRGSAPTTMRWIVMGLTVTVAIAVAINSSRFIDGVGPLVMAAAVIGSILNLSSRQDELAKLRNARDTVAYFFWKCVVAVGFALVLYAMMLSNLITGDIFPKFNAEATKDFTDMWAFWNDVAPAQNVDVAKLLFWSFAAGYSERFVPNLVANVVTKEVRGDGADRDRHEDSDAVVPAVPTSIDGALAAPASARDETLSGDGVTGISPRVGPSPR